MFDLLDGSLPPLEVARLIELTLNVYGGPIRKLLLTSLSSSMNYDLPSLLIAEESGDGSDGGNNNGDGSEFGGNNTGGNNTGGNNHDEFTNTSVSGSKLGVG